MNYVVYRPIVAGDSAGLLELLNRIRPTIARVASLSVYRAVIRDAIKSKDVVIFIAEQNLTPVGYLIAARNWRRFKRTFFARHPLAALSAVGNYWRSRTSRVCKKRSGAETAVNGGKPPSSLIRGRSWNDCGDSIAKVLHIGVDEQARSQGIAQGLYLSVMDYLRQLGFDRLDAHISASNTASINLHRKLGFVVERVDGGYFAHSLLKPTR